ncbi:MAG: Ig-like domain-containing protein [Gemmatimonadota bacterium]|nr:Ig-like domain-containing protein [Gemmatimonadota bacterium]
MSSIGPPRVATLALFAVFAVVGCANEQPPPGALPDHQPPRIESIEPAPDSVVLGFDGQVRIRFDEPVRVESGSFGQQLIASPMESYTVETGFSDVRLAPRDGWRDSVVYCLEIPAGIRDVLSNQTRQGTEFCFSTGVPIIDSRVTGTVLDAVTGVPAQAASVIFLAEPDSVPYGALTDAEGRFQLRALPAGSYTAFGFMDRNRNFRLDRALEPHDSAAVTSFDGAQPDLLFSLVEPDTTPPILLRAEAPDSMTVRVEFDDPLVRPQPGTPTIAIADSATGAPIAVFGVRVGEPSEVAFPGDPAAVTDSAAADTAAAPLPPAPPVEDSTVAAPELPSRFVTVRLADGIEPGTYRVRAEGFVNLRRLTGGGDTTFVVERDSVVAPPDSAALAPDSLAAVSDTLGAEADTAGVSSDTLRAMLGPAR